MSELIVPRHLAEEGARQIEERRVVLSCTHREDARTCAICGGEEGRQHELDRQVEEIAGTTDPNEWVSRARKFLAKRREVKLIYGRKSTEYKNATRAIRQCLDIAKVLAEAAGRRSRSRGSTEALEREAPMVRVPVSVDLQREANHHAQMAHRLKQEKGRNHPDVLRHQKAAKRLNRLAKRDRKNGY